MAKDREEAKTKPEDAGKSALPHSAAEARKSRPADSDTDEPEDGKRAGGSKRDGGSKRGGGSRRA
jgi:hypothetical protein